MAVDYPALEVHHVLSLGLAIRVESPDVERVDVGGISSPSMRRPAVGPRVRAAFIDADRNRRRARMRVSGIFKSDQRLEKHRRLARRIVSECRHSNFVRRITLGDGAEMIQILPIVEISIGAACRLQIGFIADYKSEYRGMIAVTLRQPLGRVLDEHSLVVQ